MTEEPTAKQIEAVLTFAERGYLCELGAIDARYTCTAEEAAEMKERFRLYREGAEALQVLAGATAPVEPVRIPDRLEVDEAKLY